MSEENVDYQKARDFILARKKAAYSQMSKLQRNLPAIPWQDPVTLETVPLSPNDILQEIERLTPIGKALIKAELRKIGQLPI